MKELKYDVVVIGAGCAGICAAVSAGREGKKVLIVEKNSSLGGTSTLVLDTMNGFYLPGKDNLRVVYGLPGEIYERLDKKSECFERANTYGSGTVITYNPEALKDIYLSLLEESNVDILLHSTVINVEMLNDRSIDKIVITNKEDTMLVKAKVYIDCSGDADVAFKSGFKFDGVGGKEHVQSLTTTFRVANIDETKASTFTKKDMWTWMKEANGSGKYSLPRLEGSFHKTTIPGCVQTNMVRVVLDDPTDIISLSKAEIEGRKQVNEYFNFMREYLPGYENSILSNVSTNIGVRETRRIIGEYVLTEEDVLEGKKFDDGVILCGSPIEDHNQSCGTKWKYLKENDAYLIPYRCLVPKQSENLIVAGRCLSATHSAHAASRSIAQCMGMGEAAGKASSISIDEGVPVKDISVEKLKMLLKKNQVKLELGE